MKKKENIKLEGSKLRLVENRSHTVRTGSVVFYNPKTDYKRAKEKRDWKKDIYNAL